MRQSLTRDARSSDAPNAGRPPAARLLTASTIDGLIEKVSFRAEDGELTTVYGPAGAGKSALADVLRLSKRVHSGGFDVLGQNALKLSDDARAKLKRRIGCISQTPRLFEHLSALRNVLAPVRLLRPLTEEDERDAAEAFAYLGLKMRDERPVSFLSGSERRRIAVVRAAITRPDLLIADEPCAGLAPEAAARVLKLILQARRAGAAVVVLTQDEDLAHSLPGPVWQMIDGLMSPPADMRAA
jgi:ABC-type lipoprotein export system ATPase subunit